VVLTACQVCHIEQPLKERIRYCAARLGHSAFQSWDSKMDIPEWPSPFLRLIAPSRLLRLSE
jgi:hypothetical protein